jgi:hypothetical protein
MGPILKDFGAMDGLHVAHARSKRGRIYALFLQNDPLALLQKVPLGTRLQMHCHLGRLALLAALFAF